MSLILEALRKLEREKGRPEERGFVVLGSAGGGGRRPPGRAIAAAAAAIAVGALGALAWQRLGPSDETRAPEPTTTTLEAVRAPRPTAARPAPATEAPAPPKPRVEEASAGESVAAEPSAAPTPSFRLQAITLRDGRPVALLNDRLVREGDSFDGVRVVRIGEMEVELETPSGSLIVRF